MKWPPVSRARRAETSLIVHGLSTRWQRPPWDSVAAVFSREVEAGITAMKGRARRRAQEAPDTAVEPLEASITVLPSRSQPLASAYRNSERASRCLRLPVGWLDSSLR